MLFKCIDERVSSSVAFGTIASRHLLVSKTELLAGCYIFLGPKTRQRREIVRSRTRNGIAWILFWCAKPTIMISLEHKYAGRECAFGRKPLAKAFRHGTQIFADDHAAIALRFKRDDSKHGVEIVVNICAATLWVAARYAEQPLETHNMVDTQGTRVLHIRTHEFDEGLIRALREHPRV